MSRLSLILHRMKGQVFKLTRQGISLTFILTFRLGVDYIFIQHKKFL